jgi:hypothetical protein
MRLREIPAQLNRPPGVANRLLDSAVGMKDDRKIVVSLRQVGPQFDDPLVSRDRILCL